MNIKFSKLPARMPTQSYQNNYLPFSLGAVVRGSYHEITSPLRCTDFVSDYLFVGNKVVEKGFKMYGLNISRAKAIKFVRAPNKVVFFYSPFRSVGKIIDSVLALHKHFNLEPAGRIESLVLDMNDDVFRRNKTLVIVPLSDFWVKSPALMSLFLKYVRDGEPHTVSSLAAIKELLPSLLKLGLNLNLRKERYYTNVHSTIHNSTGVATLLHSFDMRKQYKTSYDRDPTHVYAPVINDHFSTENKT